MNNSSNLCKASHSKIAFLPIKPKYVDRFIDGTKRYEFRRRPISPDTTHVILYATYPRKEIVAFAKVTCIEKSTPKQLWKDKKLHAGISEIEYREYFKGSKIAYAIEVDMASMVVLPNSIPPHEIDPDFVVPQSFRYVDSDFLLKLV